MGEAGVSEVTKAVDRGDEGAAVDEGGGDDDAVEGANVVTSEYSVGAGDVDVIKDAMFRLDPVLTTLDNVGNVVAINEGDIEAGEDGVVNEAEVVGAAATETDTEGAGVVAVDTNCVESVAVPWQL